MTAQSPVVHAAMTRGPPVGQQRRPSSPNASLHTPCSRHVLEATPSTCTIGGCACSLAGARGNTVAWHGLVSAVKVNLPTAGQASLGRRIPSQQGGARTSTVPAPQPSSFVQVFLPSTQQAVGIASKSMCVQSADVLYSSTQRTYSGTSSTTYAGTQALAQRQVGTAVRLRPSKVCRAQGLCSSIAAQSDVIEGPARSHITSTGVSPPIHHQSHEPARRHLPSAERK